MVVAAAVLLVDIIARDTYRFVNQGSALSINALRHGALAKWVGLDDFSRVKRVAQCQSGLKSDGF